MMNYAQVLEQIEQLKIGKKVPKAEPFLEKYAFKNIIYIPAEYEYDVVGEMLDNLLKQCKVSVGRFTTYAMKRPLGHILYQGKAISQKEFARCGGELLLGRTDTQETASFSGEISMMEMYLQIALKLFAEKQVEYLILPSDDKCRIAGLKEKLEEVSVLEREKVIEELVVSYLVEQGLLLKEKQIAKVPQLYKGEGRFELLKKKPYFVADGADDGSSVKLLMAKLQYNYPNNPYIFIVGTMQERYEEVVKESALMASHIITVTTFEFQNALPSLELAEEYKKLNPNITNVSSIEEAVEIATILADKGTVVAAFGTTAILDSYRNVVLKQYV